MLNFRFSIVQLDENAECRTDNRVISYLDYQYYRDRIFTITPQVEMELNMTKWFRINVGVGYRFVAGIDATYEQGENTVKFYEDSDFNSPVGTISFIFGGPKK